MLDMLMDRIDRDIVVCPEAHFVEKKPLVSLGCLLISHSYLFPQAQAQCSLLFLSFFVISACCSQPGGASRSIILLFL